MINDEKSREDLFLGGGKRSPETTKDRLALIKGDRTLRAVSEQWGIPLSTVTGWIIRGSQPQLEAAFKVAKAEGVNLEWLATGKGDMYVAQPVGQNLTVNQLEKIDTFSDTENLVKVPAFDIEAAAGAGAWINSENVSDYWCVPRTWLRLERLEHAELCIINATGDSMAPNINGGDRLLVKTNIDRDVAPSGVYVINLDGYLRVKRLAATLFPAGYRITSDNELYPEEFIPADELDGRLSIIGEVVRVLATSVPQPEERRGPVRGKTHSPSLELIA
ncbi:LexA family transcriptional regulator [Aeromonas rivuli]|uniref:LexA family transcriptional regulator n=1 Tax=Aeromonas rivuli TaxID=648794 RepID=UPI0006942A98|nr:S24 family peptidase [Aeromonas rivuli]